MTIHVVTPDHGTITFLSAKDWETGQEEGDLGNLWVGTGDLGAAEFSRGAWSYVYEVKDPEPAPEPRQWESLLDVPEGVAVSDRDGDVWKVEGGRRYIQHGGVWDKGLAGPDWHQFAGHYSPYVEVLDD